MDSNNHPHYIWAFVAVIAIGIIAWVYAANRADQENFAKGAVKVEKHSNNWPFSINIGEGACATLGELMKGKHGNTIKPAK